MALMMHVDAVFGGWLWLAKVGGGCNSPYCRLLDNSHTMTLHSTSRWLEPSTDQNPT